MSRIDIEKMDLSGWPLPDDYLAELGRIALLWGRLENLLRNVIANLSGLENLTDPRFYVVFNQPTFEENTELLNKLCEQLLPGAPNLKRYPQIIDQLKLAKRQRDLYLGGGMSPNPGNGDIEMDVINVLGQVEEVSRKIEIADLKRVIMQIDDVQHALYNLVVGLERPDRPLID
jgi:hypothetical protein